MTPVRSLHNKATIDDVDVDDRTVLVRVDFNVPIQDGVIVDDRRIRASLPTIEALRARRAKVVLATHLGRPRGAVSEELRVGLLADRLSRLIGSAVARADDVVGPSAQAMVAGLEPGQIGMLENVRFEPGEETNDPDLARRMAELADVYCNDAFGTAHRAHASTEGVAHVLPAVAGYLMERELEVLAAALDDPQRPLIAIIGGAKVSSKLGVLRHLLPRVDTLWVAGAMACTFYLAAGEPVGRSLVEPDQVDVARALVAEAERHRGRLRLPVDMVVADGVRADAGHEVVRRGAIPPEREVVDIGPATAQAIGDDLVGAGTVVWNGPLGVYEIPAFAAGTATVAQRAADCGGTTVIGGGDLAAAVDAAGVADRMTHISTGGGATLEFLEGRTLPGVAVLRDRANGV